MKPGEGQAIALGVVLIGGTIAAGCLLIGITRVVTMITAVSTGLLIIWILDKGREGP